MRTSVWRRALRSRRHLRTWTSCVRRTQKVCTEYFRLVLQSDRAGTPVLDRERSKCIRPLRLNDLEVVAGASRIKDKEEEDRLAEQLPQTSISHNTRQRADCGMKQGAAVDVEESANLGKDQEEADALQQKNGRLRIGGRVMPSGFVNGLTKWMELQGWTM